MNKMSYLFGGFEKRQAKKPTSSVSRIISCAKDVWEKRFGVKSFIHHARMGAVAKSLLDAYSEDEITGAWDVYVSQLKDPKYGNPQSFRSAIGPLVFGWKLKSGAVAVPGQKLITDGSVSNVDNYNRNSPSMDDPNMVAGCMVAYFEKVTGVSTISTSERIELAKRMIGLRGLQSACAAVHGAAKLKTSSFVPTFESVFGSDSGFDRFLAIGSEGGSVGSGRLYME